MPQKLWVALWVHIIIFYPYKIVMLSRLHIGGKGYTVFTFLPSIQVMIQPPGQMSQ